VQDEFLFEVLLVGKRNQIEAEIPNFYCYIKINTISELRFSIFAMCPKLGIGLSTFSESELHSRVLGQR
jgi:hypothetical protein